MSAAEELIGRALAGHRLTRVLGAGASAVVFRAESTFDPGIVRALKVIEPALAASPAFLERLRREARILERLHHPHVVRFHGVSQDQGWVMLVLELLDGRPLSLVETHGPDGRPDAARVLEWLRQAGEGLAAAHQLGIVHRDVKPSNLFLTSGGVVKVLDFGVARAESAPDLTKEGHVVGTPQYVAPELLLGTAPPGPAADVFALGVTLYELLLGFHPLAPPGTPVRSATQWLAAQVTAPYPRLARLRPDLPAAVAALVDRAVARDPGSRPADGAAFAAAVTRAQATLGAPGPVVGAPAPGAPAPAVPAPAVPAPGAPAPGVPSPGAPAPAAPAPGAPAPGAPAPAVPSPGPTSFRLPRPAPSAAGRPAGPVGPAGPAGPAGPVGPAGPAGLAAAPVPPSGPAPAPRGTAGRGRRPWALAAAALVGLAAAAAAVAIGAGAGGALPDGDGPAPAAPDAGGAAPPAEPAGPEPVPDGWARIEPGEFTMGAPGDDPDRHEDEVPHRVRLTRAFLLKRTEVTQGEWQRVMGTAPSWFAACGADCPVEGVSWFDAVEYLNRLSRAERREPCYELSGCAGTPGGGCESSETERRFCRGEFVCADVRFAGLDCRGYRLPTEAEWEYAARAGAAAGPRAAAPDAVAWYADNAQVDYAGGEDCSGWVGTEHVTRACGPHPVGGREANPWGLSDMQGNVWEWCGDWHGALTTAAVRDPTGPADGTLRVRRGGSFDSGARSVRPAYRRTADPGLRRANLGFRPARTAR